MGIDGAKKKKKKRTYNTDPNKKINVGKPWAYNLKFDEDVAKKVIEEQTKVGAEYGIILNRRLRKSYGLPSK